MTSGTERVVGLGRSCLATFVLSTGLVGGLLMTSVGETPHARADAQSDVPAPGRVEVGRALEPRRIGACVDGTASTPPELARLAGEAIARTLGDELGRAEHAGFADTSLVIRWITDDPTSPSSVALATRLPGVERPPRLVRFDIDVNPFDREAKAALARKRARLQQRYARVVSDRLARLEEVRSSASPVVDQLLSLQPPAAPFTDIAGCPIAFSDELKHGDTLVVVSDFHAEGPQSQAGRRPLSLDGVRVLVVAWCTQSAAICRDQQADFGQSMKEAGAETVKLLTPTEVQTHVLELR